MNCWFMNYDIIEPYICNKYALLCASNRLLRIRVLLLQVTDLKKCDVQLSISMILHVYRKKMGLWCHQSRGLVAFYFYCTPFFLPYGIKNTYFTFYTNCDTNKFVNWSYWMVYLWIIFCPWQSCTFARERSRNTSNG